MTYNSRLAQELGKWADTVPGGEAIHDALYRAYFVDGRNLADPEVLVQVAEGVGLPGAEAREGDRLVEVLGFVKAHHGRCDLVGLLGHVRFSDPLVLR